MCQASSIPPTIPILCIDPCHTTHANTNTRIQKQDKQGDPEMEKLWTICAKELDPLKKSHEVKLFEMERSVLDSWNIDPKAARGLAVRRYRHMGKGGILFFYFVIIFQNEKNKCHTTSTCFCTVDVRNM